MDAYVGSRGPEYSAVQVCGLAMISYRQLDYWTRNGWLPDVEVAPGNGAVRVYSERDLVMVKALARASRLRSMSLPVLARALGAAPLERESVPA